jgi:hypothetical protein
LAANPAGSKKPTGGRAPTRPAGAAALGAALALAGAAFLTARVAESAVLEAPCWPGAKAAAVAARVERMASFMVLFRGD